MCGRANGKSEQKNKEKEEKGRRKEEVRKGREGERKRRKKGKEGGRKEGGKEGGEKHCSAFSSHFIISVGSRTKDRERNCLPKASVFLFPK